MKTFEQRGHDSNKSDIYNYDALYRLKDITFNADSPISPTTFEKKKELQFDKVDNILKIVEQTPTSTHELINTLTGVNAQLNQYTQFDQWGLAHDLNGNTSQKGTQFFTYDYRNRLILVSGEGLEVSFKYDVLGRRIEKSVGANLIKYYYSKNNVIEERDNSDNVLKQFIYGNGIDEVLRVDKYESGNPIPYYFHTNGTGSVTAITDGSGNLVERYSYDIYGMPTITDNTGIEIPTSSIDNDYLFHSRRYDKETNLYYYRARYYDPIMGRFLSTDPMGYQDSMNMYQAFNMNGINFIDPMGEIANPLINSKVAKSAYVQFRRYYGNHAAAMIRMYAYKYAIRTGVDDTLSKEDELYEMSLGMSPILDGGKKLLTAMAIADTAVIGVASAASVSWIKLAVDVYNTIAMYAAEGLVTSTVGYNLYKGKEGIRRVVELIKRSPELVAKIKELIFKAGYYKEQMKYAFDEKVGGVTKKLFERFLPQAKEISEEGVGKFIRDFIKGSAKANIPGPPRLNTLGEYVGYIFTLIVKKTAGK